MVLEAQTMRNIKPIGVAQWETANSQYQHFRFHFQCRPYFASFCKILYNQGCHQLNLIAGKVNREMALNY